MDDPDERNWRPRPADRCCKGQDLPMLIKSHLIGTWPESDATFSLCSWCDSLKSLNIRTFDNDLSLPD